MPKMRIRACHHRRAGLFNHLGFMGASSTVNRCGKCGFKWKPY